MFERQWQADQDRFDRLFDNCGRIAEKARKALERGDSEVLGDLMNENQVYLREMTVSSPELEVLIQAAIEAGALGGQA